MLHHFLSPPNWFTAASIFCSVTALSLLIGPTAAEADVLARAAVLIVFGGIFDLLDGRVARLTKRQSEFGVQLDSIADIIGFGVAPAMLAWAWKLSELGTLGVVVAFWYVLSASFRLARFNVEATSQSWPYAGHTRGLTSTMSGGILVTLVWVANGTFLGRLDLPVWALASFVCLLGLLMLSSVPFRSFRDLRRNRIARRLLGASLAACLTAAFVVDFSVFFATGAVLYLVAGLIDGFAVALVHGRLGPALLLGEDEELDRER